MSLKTHVLEIHPVSIKCSYCIQTFQKNYELEYHMKTCHENCNEYECEKCKKKFVLEWRLKKHMKNHDQPASLIKKCHFYNNGKECPYEEIGCMFAHVSSEICKFRKTCKNKLCSFKHELVDGNNLDQLEKDFKKLSSNEQFDSKEVLCDYICAAPYGYHKCLSEEDFERFAGCDLTKFSDSYDEVKDQVTEHFPCKNCGKNFKEDEHLQEHFEKSHEKDDAIECPVKNCEFKSKSVSSLIMHIGVHHYDLVSKKLS